MKNNRPQERQIWWTAYHGEVKEAEGFSFLPGGSQPSLDDFFWYVPTVSSSYLREGVELFTDRPAALAKARRGILNEIAALQDRLDRLK